MIDEIYEFLALRFFDFIKGESEEETRKAEIWFDKALAYAPPFMPRIKTGRSFKMESLCNFNEATDQMQKDSESSNSTDNVCYAETRSEPEPTNVETNLRERKTENKIRPANLVSDKIACEEVKKELECPQVNESVSTQTSTSAAAHNMR